MLMLVVIGLPVILDFLCC